MHTLHQAIKQQNTFMAGLFLAEHFQDDIDIGHHIVQIEHFIQGASSLVQHEESCEQKIQSFLRYFHTELAFSGDENQSFAPNYNFLDKVVDYRTGIPMTLAVLFCQVGNAVGLKLKEVAFPGHYLVRAEIAPERYWFIDPVDGKHLDWHQLLALYRRMTGDEAAENVPSEALVPVACENTVVRMLHNIKGAFINKKQYQEALECTEVLLELCPDDPYERRDRGFLLHQLDCPHLALADYNYFIKHCPQDPISDLLRIQISTMGQCEMVCH